MSRAGGVRTFRFYVPAMVILDVGAPTRRMAERVAADWQDHANRWEYVAELDGVADAFDADERDQAATIDGHALVMIDTKRGPHLAVVEDADGHALAVRRRTRCETCHGRGRLGGTYAAETCGSCAGKGYPWTPCRNFGTCGRAARYGDACSRACRNAPEGASHAG